MRLQRQISLLQYKETASRDTNWYIRFLLYIQIYFLFILCNQLQFCFFGFIFDAMINRTF
jgi:hypothetical protein